MTDVYLMNYDVVVVGAGVIGSLIARELSRYNLKIALVEKHNDMAMATSKANSAMVHAGFDAKEGSLKAKLNVRGSEMMEDVARELGVKYKRNEALVVGFESERAEVEALYEKLYKALVPALFHSMGQGSQPIYWTCVKDEDFDLALDIMFGEGISKIGEIVDLGVDYGIIRKAGSWFSYGEQKIGQGRDAVKELLKNNEELRNEIEEKLREAMKTQK